MSARRLRELARRWVDEAGGADAETMIVQVLETRGSTPREAGARMLVRVGAGVGAGADVGVGVGAAAGTDGQACHGTIGGGHLEWRAIARARALLAAGAVPDAVPGAGECRAESDASDWIREPVVLGPSLGQCCGGAVVLGYRRLDARALADWPPPQPLFRLCLYGAGHVGRALVRQLAPLDVVVDWFDEREAAFADAGADPVDGVATIRRHRVEGLDAEAAASAAGSFHLVATHSHDLDLRIVEAILRRDAHGWLGLVGSRTKRARFEHRLLARGVDAGALARMHCPIGIDGLPSKAPEILALAVAAQLAGVALGAPTAFAGRVDEALR
ncbi:MAG: xanthine dehydrogenase accessory protein XdhC [Lautropia sp.]